MIQLCKKTVESGSGTTGIGEDFIVYPPPWHLDLVRSALASCCAELAVAFPSSLYLVSCVSSCLCECLFCHSPRRSRRSVPCGVALRLASNSAATLIRVRLTPLSILDGIAPQAPQLDTVGLGLAHRRTALAEWIYPSYCSSSVSKSLCSFHLFWCWVVAWPNFHLPMCGFRVTRSHHLLDRHSSLRSHRPKIHSIHNLYLLRWCLLSAVINTSHSSRHPRDFAGLT